MFKNDATEQLVREGYIRRSFQGSKMYTMPSFLNENTCPANTPVTFEKLTFWTLGYGGWLGVSLLPVLWSLPVSKSVKVILSILTLPTSAVVVTAVFSAFYMISLFSYHMASVMISPQFLHSCIGIVCLGVGSVGFYLGNSKRLEIEVKFRQETEETEEDAGSEEETDEETEEDVGSEGETDEETEEDVGSEGETEETEEDVGSEGETDEETEEDVGSEGETEESDDSASAADNQDTQDNQDNTWRETANFEGLRSAAPLPE